LAPISKASASAGTVVNRIGIVLGITPPTSEQNAAYYIPHVAIYKRKRSEHLSKHAIAIILGANEGAKERNENLDARMGIAPA
jgi:hypothetical protein